MRMSPAQALPLTWVVSALVNGLIVRTNAIGAIALALLGAVWLIFAATALKAPPPDRNDDPSTATRSSA